MGGSLTRPCRLWLPGQKSARSTTVPEPTSQLRVENVEKGLRRNQLVIALVKHREIHAMAPATLVDVEANSEWCVQDSSDTDWVILSAKGASASLRVPLAEPEFGSKWRIEGTAKSPVAR
jgi:hypothetical protein